VLGLWTSANEDTRFPSEEAALKLLSLALRNVVDKWEIVQHWKAALSRFTTLWEDRILGAQQR
jgi:transposase-like protein